MQNYCSRCGTFLCLGQCGTLEIFSEVKTLWSFDSAEGKIIFDMKRNNSVQSKVAFIQELLPQIVELVRQSVCANHATRLVVAPLSSSSWKRFPIQNCNHPNLIAAHSFSKAIRSKKEPMRESLRQLVYGFKDCPSRSLQRSDKKNSWHNPQADWSSELRQDAIFTTLSVKSLSQSKCSPINSQFKGKETLIVFDDVLSTGYTAARTAAQLDPQAESNWVFVAALRALKKQIRKL